MESSGSLQFDVISDGHCSPFGSLKPSTQLAYLQKYLTGINATSSLLEPSYFDRDYLDEFSSFYSRSTQGYKNVCQRLHYFNLEDLENIFDLALGGCEISAKSLQDSYLGFTIIRPLSFSPLGRTVLALYPDQQQSLPRVLTPSRKYKVNISGLELRVEGLAWQQQDSGVAACATIGLWTMFHSSSFDEHHSIPTTAEITKSAKLFGKRPFPSTGLTVEQILEAIHKQNLNPIAVTGDIGERNHFGKKFTKERFANNAAAFLRSGYPVLIIGHYEGSEGHAICGVGFREQAFDLASSSQKSVHMADQNINYFYIHDDNIGPNIRFELLEDKGAAILRSSAPQYITSGQPFPEVTFHPHMIIAAAHEDVRVSADDLYIKGANISFALHKFLEIVFQENKATAPDLVFSPRFIILRDYFKEELAKALSSGTILSKVRRKLHEEAPPMSLHVGVIRISLANGDALMDIIYDTTDPGRSMPPFTAVVFNKGIFELLNKIDYEKLGLPNFLIEAY